MSRPNLVVMGIGDDGATGLTPPSLALVARAAVLAGGRRHLDFFPDFRGERIVIEGDLDAVLRGCGRSTSSSRPSCSPREIRSSLASALDCWIPSRPKI